MMDRSGVAGVRRCIPPYMTLILPPSLPLDPPSTPYLINRQVLYISLLPQYRVESIVPDLAEALFPAFFQNEPFGRHACFPPILPQSPQASSNPPGSDVREQMVIEPFILPEPPRSDVAKRSFHSPPPAFFTPPHSLRDRARLRQVSPPRSAKKPAPGGCGSRTTSLWVWPHPISSFFPSKNHGPLNLTCPVWGLVEHLTTTRQLTLPIHQSLTSPPSRGVGVLGFVVVFYRLHGRSDNPIAFFQAARPARCSSLFSR